MNIIDRVKNIIITPAKEWDVIAQETPDSGKIVTGYVLPLAGLAAVAAFIGYSFIGMNTGFFRVRGFDWGIYHAVNVFIAAFVSVFVSSFIIDALAPSFKSEKNMARSVQLVAYSFTPAWLGGFLAILPVISFIGSLFALYGLYLLYVGLPKLKKTPEENRVAYFVVSLVVMVGVFLVIGLIMSMLIMPIMGLSNSIDIRSLRFD
ncbi:MAG: Yip1 family protein [Niabella sp.]